jgi:hypothetical protein
MLVFILQMLVEDLVKGRRFHRLEQLFESQSFLERNGSQGTGS